mgnify:CR=1 FL=1
MRVMKPSEKPGDDPSFSLAISAFTKSEEDHHSDQQYRTLFPL